MSQEKPAFDVAPSRPLACQVRRQRRARQPALRAAGRDNELVRPHGLGPCDDFVATASVVSGRGEAYQLLGAASPSVGAGAPPRLSAPFPPSLSAQPGSVQRCCVPIIDIRRYFAPSSSAGYTVSHTDPRPSRRHSSCAARSASMPIAVSTSSSDAARHNGSQSLVWSQTYIEHDCEPPQLWST